MGSLQRADLYYWQSGDVCKQVGRMMAVVDWDKFTRVLVGQGMELGRARYLAYELEIDERSYPTTIEEKRWALSRGFYPGRIELYGLTDGSYQDYLPDYHYFMMHPLNNHFRIWVNDKLTLKYVLDARGYSELMPEYYLYIENDGSYTYLMDAPSGLPKSRDFIIRLLEEKGLLALKPNNGAGGRGFIKLELRDREVMVNNEPSSLDEVRALVAGLDNYTVTEYIKQHDSLARIWPSSECTLRVIMAKLQRSQKWDLSKWVCLVSYARFGSQASGGASNLSSGGIGVGFDFDTGQFSEYGYRYRQFCGEGEPYRITCHPDTKVRWGDTALPEWPAARRAIEKTCERVGSLDFLGFDIIVANDGPKYCEINTHPSLNYEQVICNPLLSDKDAWEFFVSKGLHATPSNGLWEAYRQCVIS